jgi:hypothetical protein
MPAVSRDGRREKDLLKKIVGWRQVLLNSAKNSRLRKARARCLKL